MKKLLSLILGCGVLCSCAGNDDMQEYIFNPDYNRIAKNAVVVSKSPLYVTYEYKNITVDELAAVAAQYCHDRGEKQASLYDITLHRNNSRRATFVCKKIDE